MPRKSAPAAPAAPVETRPFAPDTTAPYGALDTDAQRALATTIAAEKASGFSGNELRAKYGDLLTGPARRRIFRAFGLDSPATIARSYGAYRDGSARAGSRHAREHGARAGEARAAAARADAQTFADALSLREARAFLRTAGLPVPAVRGGDESALRAAVADAAYVPAS